MLSEFALITGLYTRRGFAPKSILVSRSHKLGVLAAIMAAATVISATAMGHQGYGVLLGGSLVLADVFLTYRAFASYKKGRKREAPDPSISD